jgi:5-methyltetrahydrofolate--homocysteine methyltransferase
MMTPYLVSKLRRHVKGPLICKPNAGVPVIGSDGIPCYPQSTEEFASIVKDCRINGANIIGGCCGTEPEYIAALKHTL